MAAFPFLCGQALALAPGLNSAPEAPRPVAASGPFPLALEDSFRIHKVFSLLIDPAVTGKISAPWLQIEQDRRFFGAINAFERRQREGHSYTVRWEACAPDASDVTVRLEYRQQKLGSHVQAQEARYPKPSGIVRTEFAIQGDDYHHDGQVTAWRLLLLQNGRVVGLQQSFLW